jgi:hypothetical protein
MAKGDPLLSPYIWQALDNEGDAIRITVEFDNVTRAITGITVFRDPNCVYTKILIGTGADGIPDDTDKVITVPSGTTVLTQQQLRQLGNKGISTIEDFLALQITAAP